MSDNHYMDVTVSYAKDNLAALLRRLEAGEQVVVTKRGRPIAELVHIPAPPPTEQEQIDSLVDGILQPEWLKRMWQP